jgi:hypothetical protein
MSVNPRRPSMSADYDFVIDCAASSHSARHRRIAQKKKAAIPGRLLFFCSG